MTRHGREISIIRNAAAKTTTEVEEKSTAVERIARINTAEKAPVDMPMGERSLAEKTIGIMERSTAAKTPISTDSERTTAANLRSTAVDGNLRSTAVDGGAVAERETQLFHPPLYSERLSERATEKKETSAMPISNAATGGRPSTTRTPMDAAMGRMDKRREKEVREANWKAPRPHAKWY